MSTKQRVLTISAVLLSCCMGIIIIRGALDVQPLKYHPYTPQLLQQERNANKCVLVTVFGDWTMNSMLNDHLVRNSQRIKRACRRANVTYLRADWTYPSMEIEQLMSDNYFNTVPATLVYCPGSESPAVLKDYVSEDQVIAAINACTQN